MANQIRFKRASGSDPSASDLAIGEPGLRTDTAELFFKKDDGTIAKVSGGGGGPDFKYLELRNAANNGSASFPGNDFTLVEAGTTTAISPAAANTLLVSVSGVIQKPNSGTSTSGITGFIVDGSRFKTATNLPAAPDFIIYQESGGIGEPSDNTVTSAKIVDGAIVNADVNASAAIAGTKISPDFGSQNISTNGHISLPDLSELRLGGGNDLKIYHQGGSPGSNHIQSLVSNLGLNITTSNGDIKLRYGTSGKDFIICDGVTDKNVELYQNGSKRLETNSSGISVTGNIAVSGTVDGRDLATDGSKLDGIESGATADQSASEILTLIKTVDGAGSGLDADTLDGISSASFARSDAEDTITGKFEFTTSGSFPIKINGSDNSKIKLSGSNDPLIRFQEGTTDKAFIQWHSDGYINLVNSESSEALRIQSGSNGLKFVEGGNVRNVFHEGNLSVGNNGLTKNNFTDALKNKLDGIASGATNVTNNNQLTNGAGYITATLTNEQVQDIVGGMVSGNTESGITVTYQDADGTLDFSVASQTDQNFTTTLKNKLDGIASGATNVTNTNQLTNGAGFITATLTNEQVQDIVGGMVSGNTESGITVTYQDSDGTLDFSVASQTDQNFTTALKNKLDGIASGATNVTNNNQLTNGAGYITSATDNTKLPLSGGELTGDLITHNVRPDGNGNRDLGTSSHRWSNIFTSDLNLSNEGSTNDVDGTWGSFTIQEGEESLFLINKRNGKKYKFNLTEVS